jgi:meso-butanediol dehydrogenase/(S,S)-butanediol dehydrogenase/diacetyl reductase
MRFKDKHIIVTGAGGGIGRSIAHRFAAEGGRVVIADLNQVNGERVADEIGKQGGTALYVKVDVAQEQDIDLLIQKATEAFGAVHVAVSNAGIAESASSALDISPEEWDKVYAINARGSFLFSRACALNMMENDIRGAIVTLSTLMARSGKGMSGAYASSKASVVMFTKTLAKCLAPLGIRVNCVSPGVIATDIYRNVEKEMMMETGTFVDWLVEESVKSGQLLLPRKGEPEEIAAAVAFLASEDASYITAQNLSVDGGMDWCW